MADEVVLTTPSQLKTLLIEAVSIALKHHSTLSSATAPADEVLTIQQAADMLSLGTQTIYGLVSARKIPFSKPTGSRLYFSRLELNEWLRANRTATVQEQTQQYDQARAVRQTRRGGSKAA